MADEKLYTSTKTDDPDRHQNDLTIEDVKDNQGNTVPSGDSSHSPTLALSGRGPRDVILDIRNDGNYLTDVLSSINGTWFKDVDVAMGSYSFTVAERADDGAVSDPPWQVEVVEDTRLPAPVIEALVGDRLDPMQAQNGLEVRVSYPQITATDVITLNWGGRSDWVRPENGNPVGSVIFKLPQQAVAWGIGKQLDVSYSVTRSGVPVQSSRRKISVQGLPAYLLQAPKIAQAPDDHLDLRSQTDDLDLYIQPLWPFVAAGQRIWLKYRGTLSDGDTPIEWNSRSWGGYFLPSTDVPKAREPLFSFEVLKDDSDLTLLFEVTFDGGRSWVTFPERVLRVTSRRHGSGTVKNEGQEPVLKLEHHFSVTLNGDRLL